MKIIPMITNPIENSRVSSMSSIIEIIVPRIPNTINMIPTIGYDPKKLDIQVL
jgi:hypothetical protein